MKKASKTFVLVFFVAAIFALAWGQDSFEIAEESTVGQRGIENVNIEAAVTGNEAVDTNAAGDAIEELAALLREMNGGADEKEEDSMMLEGCQCYDECAKPIAFGPGIDLNLQTTQSKFIKVDVITQTQCPTCARPPQCPQKYCKTPAKSGHCSTKKYSITSIKQLRNVSDNIIDGLECIFWAGKSPKKILKEIAVKDVFLKSFCPKFGHSEQCLWEKQNIIPLKCKASCDCDKYDDYDNHDDCDKCEKDQSCDKCDQNEKCEKCDKYGKDDHDEDYYNYADYTSGCKNCSRSCGCEKRFFNVLNIQNGKRVEAPVRLDKPSGLRNGEYCDGEKVELTDLCINAYDTCPYSKALRGGNPPKPDCLSPPCKCPKPSKCTGDVTLPLEKWSRIVGTTSQSVIFLSKVMLKTKDGLETVAYYAHESDNCDYLEQFPEGTCISNPQPFSFRYPCTGCVSHKEYYD